MDLAVIMDLAVTSVRCPHARASIPTPTLIPTLPLKPREVQGSQQNV